MAATERFEMRVPVQLLERVDEARGRESRASYVKRAVEAALERPSAGSEPTRPAAPRASGPKVERVREAMTKAPATHPGREEHPPVERIGCEEHPNAGALRGSNGRWWCGEADCTNRAREVVE
jgi:uncharacterized membrane-anchored protein